MIVLRNVDVCVYFISSSVKINLPLFWEDLYIYFQVMGQKEHASAHFDYVTVKGENPARVILA